MKLKFEINFPPQFITSLIHSWRYKKYFKYWESHVDSVMVADVENYSGEDRQDKLFKWTLVKQEIKMWMMIGEQVEREDWQNMCKRRGFSTKQKYFIIDCLIHIGLGKKLSTPLVQAMRGLDAEMDLEEGIK
jgi:hypothetical protein